MKTISCLFILLLLTMQSFGQHKKLPKNKKDDPTRQIEEINSLLRYYETLSPFSENENRFELIDSISNRITTQLLKLLNDNRIINYPLETLLYQNELSISKSNDNKLFFFSIDEKTGGSYRTSKTIIHFRPSKGTVKANLFGGEASEAIATSTFGDVFILDSLNQKYFVIGGVRTCNVCYTSLAITIALDSIEYKTDIIAQYDGQDNYLEVFEYDSVGKVFSYEYYEADNDNASYASHDEKELLQHKFKSKFKFMNGAFLEIEKCEFWVKKE